MSGDSEPCIHLLDPDTCTLCNGRDAAERKRAATVLSRWPARYPSRLSCGHVPEVGEIIARLANDDIVCHECTP